jgi:Zn-dependent protease
MENAIDLLTQLAVLVLSVVIHEISHGYAALALGDPTAEEEGRLTINPLRHLDPFGSVILPALLYFSHLPILGWARPVPYNPYRLKNQKWGPAIVGAAGPLANILLAVIFGVTVRFLPHALGFASGVFLLNMATIASSIVLVNLMLACFNLVPIPPLDGSKVLFALLPYRWRDTQFFLERYGVFLLLIFIFFFAGMLAPVVFFLYRLITGSSPFF